MWMLHKRTEHPGGGGADCPTLVPPPMQLRLRSGSLTSSDFDGPS